jgi:cyanophycinase
MIPKGQLLIIGGAEDKGGERRPLMREISKQFENYEIITSLLPSHRTNHTIEIITTASRIPFQMGIDYIEAFRQIGFNDINAMHIQSREDAGKPEFVERVLKAHAVLFSGGDQLRLSTILSDTPVFQAVKSKYFEEADFVLAGTSAGAMAMGGIMIYQGKTVEAVLKGEVRTTAGFALLPGCIIDTHFVKRGRFARLAQVVAMNRSYIGIGLNEDTALRIRNGNEAECSGSGIVVIIDGSGIKHSNVGYVEQDKTICIEHLIVHILAKGNGFRFKEKQFVP